MRILIATDFSQHATNAVALVRAMPLSQGSLIRVINAIEPITTVGVFAPSAFVEISDTTEREVLAELRKITDTLTRTDMVTADAVVRFGRAADVVIDEAANFAPDLIVVGSRGRGGLASAVLGSVSAEIVDRASCPVLVARAATLTRLVLGDDGSTSASAAALAIAGLAPFARLPVRVVSVVDVPFPMVVEGAGAAPYYAYEAAMPALRAAHAQYASERAASLGRLGITATSEHREGDAAAELIDAAREFGADCIVVATRGQTGLQRVLLGSVARGVLFHAPCSVLIAHSPRLVEAARSAHDAEPAHVG